jgi:hypothetical protein
MEWKQKEFELQPKREYMLALLLQIPWGHLLHSEELFASVHRRSIVEDVDLPKDGLDALCLEKQRTWISLQDSPAHMPWGTP